MKFPQGMSRAQPDLHVPLEMVYNLVERTEFEDKLTWIKSSILLKCAWGYSGQKQVFNDIRTPESKVVQLLDMVAGASWLRSNIPRSRYRFP